ncbi:Hypothetical protein CGLY_16480 (plasmid) [Corynebacterium glyciniphilum AJ 3170]|uniref:Uncharacterized protein n=1 Tax=Corynebacterium glyciniphilum AJ 3170 TaxID=1404245 RepID=X5DWI0_9CORY|nr:Hypothetical protein CGLY_16480 [Corynebacterium glyciniphilum AJ 3170]
MNSITRKFNYVYIWLIATFAPHACFSVCQQMDSPRPISTPF